VFDNDYLAPKFSEAPKGLTTPSEGQRPDGARGSNGANHFVLTLYIAGHTPRAELAIANLRRLCDEDLGGQYKLEIVDVREQPEAAEAAKILATPTLIKQLPPPLRRVIGDLSDREKLLLGLDLHSAGGPKAGG